ncbi:MAG: hypothetical protein ACHQIG_12110 [Acidimicrobiia bacterium]
MRRLSLLLVALALVLAGCKADTTVTVDMRDDGSGTVTVDAHLDAAAVQAVQSAGSDLDKSVRLGDLAKAGWKITPWAHADDGSATIQLSKGFTSPGQVAGILGEVSGTNGPLRDVRAKRDRGILATNYDVTGAVDLGAIATGVTADPDLVASLTNQQVDVNALDQSLLQQLRDSVSVQVVVNLPGATTTITGVPGQRVELNASSTVRDTRRIVLILVAIGLLVLAVIVWFGGRRSRYRARVRGPIPRFDPHGRRG